MAPLTRTTSISSQMSDQSSGVEKAGGTTGQRALSGMKRFLGRRDKERKSQTSSPGSAHKAADDDEDEELLSPGLLDTVKPKAGRTLGARPASTILAGSPTNRSGAMPVQSMEPLGHVSDVTSLTATLDAIGKPASMLRKQTSYSSISNASSANSSASTRSGLPTVGGLPRSRTTSTASFTAPSAISSISASQSRRISSAHRDLPSLAQRNRTTSITSPAATANASFSASPNKRGSRVPVASVSARRLGSVQSIRGLEATPRPATTFAKAQHGMVSTNDESPGLEVLVANTTLSMQDLQETLSPLTSAVSRQDRKDRRADGSWISIDHDDIENINTPSRAAQKATLVQKPRQAVKASTTSITGVSARSINSVLPRSLTNDGLPLPPSRSLQRKTLHSPVPLQPKVASQPVSKPVSNDQKGHRVHPKVSSDIGAILDAINAPDSRQSPARYLAAESSTIAMHEDLSCVAITPQKPSQQVSLRLSEVESVRKETLEQAAQERASYEAEMKNGICAMQATVDKQERELKDLRAMLAKGAGSANRLAHLEAEHSSWKRQEASRVRFEEEVRAQARAAATQKQVFAQALAIAKLAELQKEYATEQRELVLQKDTLVMMKDLLSKADIQIRGSLLA